MSRENRFQHTAEADIVRDTGLAYREIDGGPDRDHICHFESYVMCEFYYGCRCIQMFFES